MTAPEKILTLIAVVLGTMATRFLPYFLFTEGKPPPKYISYLGGVLPCAAIGFLVVYSLKDAVFSAFHGLPEFLSILLILLLHRWRKNTLLSIGAGTVFYMYLVQTWFS